MKKDPTLSNATIGAISGVNYCITKYLLLDVLLKELYSPPTTNIRHAQYKTTPTLCEMIGKGHKIISIKH